MDGTKILSMSVENIYFLNSLNFMPMSLKGMPKSFDLTCKKGYHPNFLTWLTIWTMWALIRKLNTMGLTLSEDE